VSEAQRHLSEVMGRTAPRYDRAGPPFFTNVADRLLERVRVPPAADVLDVATGPGVMLSRLAHVHGRLVGIDLSRAMIEEARIRLAQTVELYEMDAEALDFSDDSFDFVMCSVALQQLPHPERAVAEFYRVLRPGGAAASAVFGQTDPRWHAKDVLLRRLVPPLPRVGKALDAPTLDRLFADAGFVAVRTDADHLDIVFPDEHSWLETAWSHGERRALEAMDERAYATFSAELPDALRPARERDGLTHWRPEVIFIVGAKPA
jgi:ubiquinone/menaquinone biosynthesis C-methylase UbiE